MGKLQSLIGLEAVKESIRTQLRRISTNYQRELQGKKPVETSLNRVFFGGPGTGKTSVAKLYGRILADLGLLSNGEGDLLRVMITTKHILIKLSSRCQKSSRLHRRCAWAVRGKHQGDLGEYHWKGACH